MRTSLQSRSSSDNRFYANIRQGEDQPRCEARLPRTPSGRRGCVGLWDRNSYLVGPSGLGAPCPTSERLRFWPLHCRHAVTTFIHVSRPPRESGVT